MRLTLPGLALTVVAAVAAAAAPATRYERSDAPGGGWRVTAQFLNFNEDALTLAFDLHPDAVRESLAEFGFAREEINALLAACAGCDQAEFDRRAAAFYRSRGIATAMQPNGRLKLTVNVPAVVERNKPRLRSLAQALGRIASERNYGPDQTLGAAVAFVQTALRYQLPPATENGRNIIGFYPPPRALELGLGDCDSKSALLAAMLAHFSGVRMVGVHIPKHYLVGVARVPRHGDAYVEYRGEPFVLMEAAGPAWRPPGMISDQTRDALRTMQGVRIDPLF
ncbi:MAG: hypothetical protein ACRES8_09590 [Nevskiaceae bacterium]